MCGRGGIKLKLKRARMEAARRDRRIAELKQTHERLQRLSDIGKLLLHFTDLERTVSEVMAVVAGTLPLYSATLIREAAGGPRAITWIAAGESARRLRAARARAEGAYRYLVRRGVDLQHHGVRGLELPPGPAQRCETPECRRAFALLPLVVGRGPILGALQIESCAAMDEAALTFVNTVANQLAIAIDRHAADQALRASEAKLAGIISIAADAIISIDEDHRIVIYNDGAEKIFGWTRDEVLGKPVDLLIPEHSRKAHREAVQKFAGESEGARTTDACRRSLSGLRKNGQEFPAEAAISKLSLGGSWLFTIVLRDVTAQKCFEHEEMLLADSGPVLAGTLDPQKTLSNVAQLAMREFADFCTIDFLDEQGDLRRLKVVASDPAKAGIAEALERYPLDMTRPHLGHDVLASKQPLLLDEVTPETLRSMAQSEEHLRLLQAIAPTSLMGVPLLLQDRLVGAIVVASCGNRRRYSPADLHLLAEVGRRAVLALENARLHRVTERAVQARDDVLSIVAHDLRNPLSTILMQAAMLRYHARELGERARKPGEAIERAAARMKRLIEDLLDVSKVEAGALSIDCSRVVPQEVICDSVEAQKPLASSASQDLCLEIAPELPAIWADRDRLLQIFENLIGNASKFTGAGGRITVGARPGKGEVLFWVADTGAGVRATDVPHLFDRFWQSRRADRRVAERRGAGLGLAIVKGIVEAHGCKVWVESTPGRGSTFYFTLPAAPPAGIDRASESHAAP